MGFSQGERGEEGDVGLVKMGRKSEMGVNMSIERCWGSVGGEDWIGRTYQVAMQSRMMRVSFWMALSKSVLL